MGRAKTTVYVDSELLRAAKVEAARTGKRDSDIFEGALRAYLGFDLVERAWSRSDLTEEKALELAYDEVHKSRK